MNLDRRDRKGNKVKRGKLEPRARMESMENRDKMVRLEKMDRAGYKVKRAQKATREKPVE